ncbi:MAG: M14 metallopeptidase family protein [Bacteroidia bacterium]
MNYRYLFLVYILMPLTGFGQLQQVPSLSYYLPAGVDYDPGIPTPVSVLGRDLGAWHFTAAEIEIYMRELANASDRIAFQEIGYSYEGRRLYVLYISSARNVKDLESLRLRHLELSDPSRSQSVDLSEEPVVVWQGHTIHGNEPSGSHAAMAYAYHLAAARDRMTRKWLDDAIIILDPCMNPDGLQRFATWVNSHQSLQAASNPLSREFHEAWPGGRTNHYWFDLNRDWLPAQHPESQARLALFHEWKPNVLTDHHEMGSNSTYFFQPGVPSRNNPLTPDNTFQLTRKLARYHARDLDSIGSTYFSEERFDDFYYGKGSTYPDANGAVGVLFEQASSRGHAQDTENGLLTFPFTIRNQLTTSFSTLKGALGLRKELLEHQRDFYTEALILGKKSPHAGWVFSDDDDPVRARKFLALLERHRIEVETITENVKIESLILEKNKAWFVPAAQAQYRLVTSMFEQRTEFADSLFYDVSAWTLPLAFGLPFEAVSRKNFKTGILALEYWPYIYATKPAVESTVGYLIPYHQYHAPKAVASLLQAGLRCKVATLPFTNAAGRKFPAGTIFIPSQNQKRDPEAILTMIRGYSQRLQLEIISVENGLSPQGIDLGSRDMKSLRLPNVAILIGDGISSYEAGSLWYYVDRRLGIPATLLDLNKLRDGELDKFNTLIMPGGNYNELSSEALKSFVSRGGNVIAQKRALYALNSANLALFELSFNRGQMSNDLSYEERDRARGAQVLGGAIFEVNLDLGHPLCFGFTRDIQAVFKNNGQAMLDKGPSSRYPYQYTDAPLLAGYASEANKSAIAQSPGVASYRVGRGTVTAMLDEACFRAFWLGSERFMANAILFGPIIQ